MSKNKDPAVLFYTSDFLASTLLWSYEDIGRYIRLLCLQHQQGGLTEGDLSAVAEGSERVRAKFTQGEDGLYFNARMLEESERRANYLASQRNNASKGGQARWQNRNNATANATANSGANAPDMPQLMPRQCPGGNGNINRNINNNDSDNSSSFYQPFSSSNQEGQIEEKIEEIEENGEEVEEIEKMFLAFWQAYPKKKAKADAHARWMKMKPSRALLQIMLTAIEEQKKSKEWTKDGGQYIPYPATWLHRGQWEDEMSDDTSSTSSVPRYSNCDAEEVMKRAFARSYATDD